MYINIYRSSQHTAAHVDTAVVKMLDGIRKAAGVDLRLDQQDRPQVPPPPVSALHAPLLLSLTGVCGLKLLVYAALSN